MDLTGSERRVQRIFVVVIGLFALMLGVLGASRALAVDVTNPHGKAEADAYRGAGTNVDPATMATGKDVYERVCAACHETGVNRAPQRFILKQMTPESVLKALESGVMQMQGSMLTPEERKAAAQFVTERKLGAVDANASLRMCTGDAARFDMNEPPVFNGWGLDAASTHNIAPSVAGITPANAGKLKLKWAFGFPNGLRARSQPSLAGGAVFVGSHGGTVYALDRETGCVRWTFDASAEVRTGIVISPWTKGDAQAKSTLYFGDIVGTAYAVDTFTGKLVWRKKMEDHHGTTLTGAPALYGDTLMVPVSSLEEGSATDPNYPCCTFRGSIAALDSATGEEKWRTYFTEESKQRGTNSQGAPQYGPSGIAVWSSPAVDEKRGLIYVTTGDNYSTPATELSDAIIALDIKSGAIKWSYQALPNDAWNGSCGEVDKANCPDEDGPDFDFGAGAVLAKGADGHDYVLAGQKSGIAYGLNPDTGKLVWQNKVGRGGVVGGIHFGLAASKGRLYVPVSDVPDGKTYDMAARPGIFAVDVATGKNIWDAPSANVCEGRPFCHPGYSGAISSTDDLVLAGSNDGYVRIYDAASGKIVWQDDTKRDFVTVNGVAAHGGSIGGGTAPIAYQGMLLVNSGYGFAGKMSGNVLLAYEVAPE